MAAPTLQAACEGGIGRITLLVGIAIGIVVGAVCAHYVTLCPEADLIALRDKTSAVLNATLTRVLCGAHGDADRKGAITGALESLDSDLSSEVRRVGKQANAMWRQALRSESEVCGG